LYVCFAPSPIETANASMLKASARITTSITFKISTQYKVSKKEIFPR
jgi:hypothetical protein